MSDRSGSASPLRVCLVSGAPDAGRCGIHDYVGQLASALAKVDRLEAAVLAHQDWSPLGTVRLLRRIRALRPHIVHMQYPMIVGWRSLGPQALGFLAATPQVVTLHEFSSFTKLRRATVGAFAASAKALVFTTEFERADFAGVFPFGKAKTDVIPIGSNVPFMPHRPEPAVAIVHFGQIKPGRGIEDFLQLAQIAARNGEAWTFKVIGAPVTWAAGFVDQMRQRTKDANVVWQLNLSDADVSQALRSATAAYLPYPDGVSERRGSLIAALGNGLPVVTTRGPFQTTEIETVVEFADDPEQAFVKVAEVVRQPAKADAMRSAAAGFVSKFDWTQIAVAYDAVYRRSARA